MHKARTEVILSSKGEAELVVTHLTRIIEDYGHASVSDLYDLVGLPTEYNDSKWGWKSLPQYNLRQVPRGLALDLPDVEPLT